MPNKFALIVVLYVWRPAAWAGKDIDQDDAKALRQQGVILPLEQVLQTAQRLHLGRVIEVELDKKRGRYIYEVEIADSNGRIWELKFDASDATLLSNERDD
ncbi:MAG: PepSY domain-containing protein [Gammaproteobacteria bacterium]|nr:PepSY domain-containing protein [Gammaproteobacteria bacterium]